MFTLNGPAFVVLYLVLFVAGAGFYRLIRRRLRAHGAPLSSRLALSPAELGYLVGGPARAAAAAVAAIHESSAKGLAGDKSVRFSALEDAVVRQGGLVAVPSHGSTPLRKKLLEQDRELDDVKSRLEQLGLILDDEHKMKLRLGGLAIFGSLLAAGLARLVVGLGHGRPVGILVVLLAIVLVTLLLVAVMDRTIRTDAGEELADTMKEQWESTGTSDQASDRTSDHAPQLHASIGFALFGWSALATQPNLEADLSKAGFSERNIGGASGSGSGCSSSGCSSSGCSSTGCSTGTGCSSGGGDGGGGGCGGCGGGGD